MPSKYGFGNSRKVSPNKLSTYGADNKNPFKQGGLPGTWRGGPPGLSHDRPSDTKTRFTVGADATFGATGKKMTTIAGAGRVFEEPEIKTKLSLKPGIKFGAHGKLGLEGTRTYKTKGFFGEHSDKKKTFLGVGGELDALSFGKYTKRDDETRPSLSLSGNYGKTLGKKGFGGKGRLSFGFKKPGTTYSGGFKTNIFAEKGFGNKGKKDLKIGANVNVAGFNVEGKLNPKTGKGSVMGGLKLNL